MNTRTRLVGGTGAILVIALALPATRDPLVGLFTETSGGAAQADASPTGGGTSDGERTAERNDEPREDAGGDAREPARTTALPVGAVVVERGPFVQTIRATGRAEATRRVELAPRVGERVTGVRVTEGDHVSKDTPLVTLDSRPYEIARREAEARIATAEADRRVTLLDDEDADSTRKTLARHRSGLTEAEQALERATLDLEGTTLAAPFAGEVARVDAVVGGLAQAGTPLVTLVDLEKIRIPAEVLESDFGALVPGAAAHVRVAAFPDRLFEGAVVALGPELDAARGTGIAYISIANPDRLVRPGMYADVEIESGVYGDRIAVPRRAVLERDRKLLVFRATAGRAEWQYVDTGLESDTMIEITRGLSPGDTVLVDGHLTLAHGAPVRPKIVED